MTEIVGVILIQLQHGDSAIEADFDLAVVRVALVVEECTRPHVDEDCRAKEPVVLQALVKLDLLRRTKSLTSVVVKHGLSLHFRFHRFNFFWCSPKVILLHWSSSLFIVFHC